MPDKDLTRAGFGPRAAAYVIDRALLFIALAFVRLPAAVMALAGSGRLTAKSFLFDHSFLDVICWVLISAYFVLLTYYTGSTLGKKVMRLRVDRTDGEPLRFIDVLYRETVGRFLSGILCLGYLMVLADRQNRAFHDWLCGTCVVYEDVSFRKRPDKPAPAYSVPGAPALAETAAPALPTLGYSVPGAPAPGPDGDQGEG